MSVAFWAINIKSSAFGLISNLSVKELIVGSSNPLFEFWDR
jgi:hypothetical protein